MNIFSSKILFAWIFFLSLAVMCIFCGCNTVPIEQQMKMRTELQDQQSHKNIELLLNMLRDDAPVDPAIYNHAMETIVYLANKKQLSKTNPELFSKIRETFLAIANDEDFEDNEDQEYAKKTKDFLRMYSIYALSQLEPQDMTSFRTYLDVLNDFNYPTVCQLPAFAGLRKIAKLYSNAPDRIVELILSICYAETRLLKSKPYNFQETRKAQKWFLQKYLSLDMFNSFWKERVYELGDNKAILRMLKLNYGYWQFLISQKKQPDLEKLKSNIDLICTFLKAKADSFPKVANHAQKVLLSSIPQKYYLYILEKVKNDPKQYFLLLAMSQWIYKDHAKIKAGKWCYTSFNEKTCFNCDRLFGKNYLKRCKDETSRITVFLLKHKIGNYSLKQKEKFYKQIAKFYPSLLINNFINDFKKTHKFSPGLKQNIRFSWQLLQSEQHDKDSRRKLLQANLNLLAQFSGTNDFERLVKLITTYYLKKYPEEIIKTVDTIFKKNVKKSNLYSLITLYIRSLEQLHKKSSKRFKIYMSQCKKTFLNAIKYRDSATNIIIYPFLSKYDPVFLVSAIMQTHFNDKNNSEIRTDFQLLGTQAVKYRKELEKKESLIQATRSQVLKIFSSNIASYDDVISLLSASFLLRLSNKNDTGYAEYLQKITMRWPQIKFNYTQNESIKGEEK